jgi:hypothetical protein
MQTRGGTPDARQEAAFRDGDVARIVHELLRHDHVGLVRAARQAVIGDPTPPRDELREQLKGRRGIDATEEQLDSAEAIYRAGARIHGRPESNRLRGGLLERYVHEMVSRRAQAVGSTVEHEAEVATPEHPHSGRDWSEAKEVVLNAAPFEVYECKFGAGNHIDQADINELGDIFLTARAESTDARPCLVTMASEHAFRARLAANGVQPDEILYFADVSDLPVLGQRPPSRRYR